MGGHRQTRSRRAIQPRQDADYVYQAAIIDFADTLGLDVRTVAYFWSQIAMAREMENGEPRDVAEYLAWLNVRDAFDCRGRAPN